MGGGGGAAAALDLGPALSTCPGRLPRTKSRQQSSKVDVATGDLNREAIMAAITLARRLTWSWTASGGCDGDDREVCVCWWGGFWWGGAPMCVSLFVCPLCLRRLIRTREKPARNWRRPKSGPKKNRFQGVTARCVVLRSTTIPTTNTMRWARRSWRDTIVFHIYAQTNEWVRALSSYQRVAIRPTHTQVARQVYIT